MLKKLPNSYVNYLTKIYNAALSMGYFPDCFKQAIVVMKPKKGKNTNNPLNYRPISLLEPIAKIYEKIINQRLKTYLEDTKLFHSIFSTQYILLIEIIDFNFFMSISKLTLPYAGPNISLSS